MKQARQLKTDDALWMDMLLWSTAGALEDACVETAEDVLDLRMFDLLNLNRIDAGRAEEILTVLYRQLNPNSLCDTLMSYGEAEQTFSVRKWTRNHRRMDSVTVGNIVLAEGINLRAIQRILDRICRAFYASDEYSPRQYRYVTLMDIRSIHADARLKS